MPRQRSNQRLPVTVDIVDDLGQQISGQRLRLPHTLRLLQDCRNSSCGHLLESANHCQLQKAALATSDPSKPRALAAYFDCSALMLLRRR